WSRSAAARRQRASQERQGREDGAWVSAGSYRGRNGVARSFVQQHGNLKAGRSLFLAGKSVAQRRPDRLDGIGIGLIRIVRRPVQKLLPQQAARRLARRAEPGEFRAFRDRELVHRDGALQVAQAGNLLRAAVGSLAKGGHVPGEERRWRHIGRGKLGVILPRRLRRGGSCKEGQGQSSKPAHQTISFSTGSPPSWRKISCILPAAASSRCLSVLRSTMEVDALPPRKAGQDPISTSGYSF